MTEIIDETTPLQRMLEECNGDTEILGERISAVLEFLTLRAVADGPYYIFTDSEEAMVLFASGDISKNIRERLDGIKIKRWEDELEPAAENFLSNVDPGDEQDDSDESAAQPI